MQLHRLLRPALHTAAALGLFFVRLHAGEPSADKVFLAPPASARPHVMWMWMGSNITPSGITHDLEKLHDAGFGGALMFSLADTTTPWPRDITGAPTPEVVAFTPPWWERVRHAALESRRLGLEFGMGNCPGYSTSGGPWITPEHAMQMVVWSETRVSGGTTFSGPLPRPTPDLVGIQPFPVWNPKNGKLERPEHPERLSFFRDIAVIAVPADGDIALDKVIELTDRHTPEKDFRWEAPPGDWIVYRFGHTIMGTIMQPPQYAATGFECDKLSRTAVEIHLDHIVSEAQKYVGDLIGTGFHYYHFDSYEASMPRWTPLMREEFRARRGYDLAPFLPTLAKRVVESPARTAAYEADFKRTVADLFRANYFPVIREKLNAAGIRFSSEPYGGPWEIPEITPHVDNLMAEFWTHTDKKRGMGHLPATIRAGTESGFRKISAEAFTSHPGFSQWDETPGSMKIVGDRVFAAGINHFVLHRFAHQPWRDRYKPGVMMGQWGTHFDHTQTWWEPGKAWVAYLTRCQALLQWGKTATSPGSAATFVVVDGKPEIRSLRRSEEKTDIFFAANLARVTGAATARFPITDRRPELWHPVTGEMRPLTDYRVVDGATEVPLQFAEAESYFIVFRAAGSPSGRPNFPAIQPALALAEATWNVAFDPAWGGPASIVFPSLTDWKDHSDAGIKYYSGTATYRTTFEAPRELASTRDRRLWLDLGVVKDLARVRLNGRDLGVVWTAPWRVEITGVLRAGENQLEIAVTNTWANRLVGDEQLPPDCEWNKGDQKFGGPLKAYPDWVLNNTPRPSAGRYTFTTWNYFNAKSPLLPSGLLGPVSLSSSLGD